MQSYVHSNSLERSQSLPPARRSSVIRDHSLRYHCNGGRYRYRCPCGYSSVYEEMLFRHFIPELKDDSTSKDSMHYTLYAGRTRWNYQWRGNSSWRQGSYGESKLERFYVVGLCLVFIISSSGGNSPVQWAQRQRWWSITLIEPYHPMSFDSAAKRTREIHVVKDSW